MRRILLVALMALACDDSWDGPDPITYTPPGASGDGGAGPDEAGGAPWGAGGEAGGDDVGGAGGTPQSADGGTGGEPVGVMAGTGGTPGEPESAWLESCGECSGDFGTCAAVVMTWGEPAEDRCTFECTTATTLRCKQLGGQCYAGLCGPVLSGWMAPCNSGECTSDEFPICNPMYIEETGQAEYRCSFFCEPYANWKACQDMGGYCASSDVNFEPTCTKL